MLRERECGTFGSPVHQGVARDGMKPRRRDHLNQSTGQVCGA